MVGILPNSLIEGDQVVDSPKKHARASRKQVSLARSRAFMALPPWIQPTIISIIVPSLIKFYGSRDEPWNIDGPSSNIFANLFNALLARLHPGHENTISKSDKVWRYVSHPPCHRLAYSDPLELVQCRQSIYDWRSNFAKLAVQLVGKAAKAQGTSAAIKIWAEGALAKGGEATYSQPNLRVRELRMFCASHFLTTPHRIRVRRVVHSRHRYSYNYSLPIMPPLKAQSSRHHIPLGRCPLPLLPYVLTIVAIFHVHVLMGVLRFDERSQLGGRGLS